MVGHCKWLVGSVALLTACSNVELAKPSEVNREEVKKVFVAHTTEIHECHTKFADPPLDSGTNKSSKMVFGFEIDDAGKVIHSQWVEDKSTLLNAKLGECIATGIKQWSFPKAATTETTYVYYPVIFNE